MIRKRLRNLGIFLGVLLLYYLFVRKTGLGIPCVFHLFTGLNCPGCGVSRMLIALTEFRFHDAFAANSVLFCLSPVFLLLIVYWTVKYVTGKKAGKRAVLIESRLYSVLVVILILWGIVRNILHI